MAKPKYDYDSDYFYQRIRESADRQMQENHIIWDKVIAKDIDLESSVFSAMKSGCYPQWSKEENDRRSEQINNVLSRARASVEPEVWRMVLEMGLGKVQDEQRITVHKLPPNLNALQMWLRHHSQMYRSIESGKLEAEENSDIPTDITHGIDIGKWIEKEVSDDKDA